MEIETRYPVSLEQDVVWGEQDAFGHVNNIQYFRYFENVRLKHFLDSGFPFGHPVTGGCGPILATASCNFLKALTFPDRIRMETGVSKIGRSSLTYLYRIWSQQHQQYVATGESVVVFIDYGTQRSTPLPPELCEAILRLEQHTLPA